MQNDGANEEYSPHHAELLVGPDVEQSAGGVVRAGGEGVTIREELKLNKLIIIIK
jgi:hypothetical protein